MIASKKALSTVALAAALGLSGIATAAPFAIQYNSVVSASSVPEFRNGATYHVVLVMDNGGSSAASQAWTGAQLTCTYWYDASGKVVYAQNLVTTPPATAGSVTTSAAGALTAVYSSVTNSDAAPDVVGFTTPLVPNVNWFANSANQVWGDTATSYSDNLGGVIMNIANWSAPRPWNVPCTAAAGSAAFVAANAVPTLSEWNTIILGGLLAIGAFFSLRRFRRR